MPPKQLSKADAQVLAQVFDPEGALNKVEIIVDPSLPAERHISDDAVLQQLRARERQAIASIELFEKSAEKSEAAKETTYRTALAILDELIAQHPQYASAWNNRAQLRRWRFGDRNMLVRPAAAADSAAVEAHSAAGETSVKDLREAIELASPARPQDAVSPAQGKLLAQSYTQLGALYYAAGKALGAQDGMVVSAPSCAQWPAERFEEEASRLFYLGGMYGNEVAKALAVHTNPHARLCGNIVKEAMRKELEGVKC